MGKGIIYKLKKKEEKQEGRRKKKKKKEIQDAKKQKQRSLLLCAVLEYLLVYLYTPYNPSTVRVVGYLHVHHAAPHFIILKGGSRRNMCSVTVHWSIPNSTLSQYDYDMHKDEFRLHISIDRYHSKKLTR